MNQDALKGLLMILVIFDHNEYAHRIFPQFLAGFSFHVVGFLALPFLRPVEPLDKNSLEKMVFSYYYPFVWITCGMAFVTMLMSQQVTGESFLKLCGALYSGDAIALKSITQMSLLWFLPSFLALMLMRSFIAKKSTLVQVSFLAIVTFMHLWIGNVASESRDYIPLGLLPAIYAIPLVFVIVFFHRICFEKMERLQATMLLSSIFLVVKYWQMHMGLSQELGFAHVADYTNLPALVINDLEAITGTLLLFHLARFNFGGVIKNCGRNSLQVYLIHAFVALGMFKAIEKGLPDAAIGLRLLISIVLTVVLSSNIARFLMENPFAKRILFPRNWRELTHKATEGVTAKW